jgi:hypothetical protein
MSSDSAPSQRDPLQPVLDEAEEELRRRLHEACVAEAKGVSTESTQEIRRLEDSLLAAAVAARHTVTLRSQMKRRPSEERERPITINEAADRKGKIDSGSEESPKKTMADEHTQTVDTRVREFTDSSGGAWRAWPVIPGRSRASASGRSFLGDFQEGWICFEGLNSPARRRLPRRQTSWADVSDDDLKRLLEEAIDAPARDTPRKN